MTISTMRRQENKKTLRKGTRGHTSTAVGIITNKRRNIRGMLMIILVLKMMKTS